MADVQPTDGVWSDSFNDALEDDEAALPTEGVGSDSFNAELQDRAPKRDGKPGQRVRRGGQVWRFRNGGWQWLRAVTDADLEAIPHARVALDDPAEADDDSAEPVATPAPATTSGGSDGDVQRSVRANVPGDNRVWKVGNDYVLVYRVDGEDGQDVFLTYTTRSRKHLLNLLDVTSVKDVDVARTFGSWQEAEAATGAVQAGSAAQLVNQSRHPWEAFNENYSDMASIAPWLRDPEIMALYAEAHLEGRTLNPGEFEQTGWWTNHSAAERQAFVDFFGDPGTFRQRRDDLEDDGLGQLTAAGFDFVNGDHAVVDYFVREQMWGRLSPEQAAQEIEKVSNPYALGAEATAGYDALPAGAEVVRGVDPRDGEERTYVRIDGRDYALERGFETAKFGPDAREVGRVRPAGAFRDYLQTTGPAQGRDAQEGIDQIKQMVRDTAGPLAAAGWRESEYARWAARVQQEGPAVLQELSESLMRQRRSFYAGYDDDATYEEIAGPWRGLVQQVWGQQPDEADPLFQDIVRLNDQAQARRLLKQKGRERGIQSVVSSTLGATTQGFGDSVRRSMV
jgi:hypothetical protein